MELGRIVFSGKGELKFWGLQPELLLVTIYSEMPA